MRIKFKTPQEPGAYLHICRADGSWTLCGDKDTEIEKVSFNDAGLGLDRYRVIVREDGQSQMRAALGRDCGTHHAEQHEKICGYLLGEGKRADAGFARDDVGKGKCGHYYRADDADGFFNVIKYLVEHFVAPCQAVMPKAAQASSPKYSIISTLKSEIASSKAAISSSVG